MHGGSSTKAKLKSLVCVLPTTVPTPLVPLPGIEDHYVSGMMSNHKLAKAVADMGFYEFRRQLEYKCQLYGSKYIVVDRWFPSSKTCSRCGQVKQSLSLSERVFNCEYCGFSCVRDLNASLNLAMAVSSTVTACGLDNADLARRKQE